MHSLAEKRDEKQVNFATEISWNDLQHREGCTYFSQEKKAEVGQ